MVVVIVVIVVMVYVYGWCVLDEELSVGISLILDETNDGRG